MRLKLLIALFSMEVRRRMSYRLDFWVTAVLNFVAAVIIPWFFWGAVYARSPQGELNGYSLKDMLLYVCVAVLVGRLVRGMEHVADVATDIYEGTLNRYLLYPASYLSLRYPQHLGALLPNILQVFIFLPFVIWLVGGSANMSVTSFLMAIPLILLANLLYYRLAFPMQTVAFWADNVWSLVVMIHMTASLLGGGMIPLALFPESAGAILKDLPFAGLYDLPIRTLLGNVGTMEYVWALLLGTIWCGELYLLGMALWRRGELSYTGVGI
jgi:ABC-2 type transport system permease protein